MVNQEKTEAIARTIGLLADVSAHIVVAGYFQQMTTNEEQKEQWVTKINQAKVAKDAALTTLSSLLLDLVTQPKPNENGHETETE